VELRDAVLARRMVRTYDPDRPVPPAAVTRLLELAVRAPSAGHSQGRDLLVLSEPADRARFWSVTAGSTDDPDRWLAGMMTAPLLVVCLADPGAYTERYAAADKAGSGREGTDVAGWSVPWWDVDTGMSALLLLLGAVDEGLGACLFGVPGARHQALREAFGVPGDRRVLGVVSIGTPAPDRRSPSLRRGRRPLSEVASAGRFGTPWRFPAG
jgi:nitroreductase